MRIPPHISPALPRLYEPELSFEQLKPPPIPAFTGSDSFTALSTGIVSRVITNDSSAHDETLAEVAKLTRNARHNMVLQTFVLDAKSQAASHLFDAIATAQKRNPDFQAVILYSTALSSSRLDVYRAAHDADARVLFIPFNPGISRRSLHSKSALFDGERAIIGGSNVDNPPENDFAVEIHGSAVIDLYKETYHAALDALEGMQTPFMTRGAVDASPTIAPLRRIIEGLNVPERNSVEPHIDIIGKRGVDWQGPYYRQPATMRFIRAITGAQKEICLRSPNVNDVVLLSALCLAARRGVTVKLLLPHGYQSFRSFIDSAANYAPLIFRAHKVPPAAKHNFQVKWFSEDGTNTGNSHAKLLVVDGTATLGSMNADNQSLCFSRELIVTISDPTSNEMIKREGFDCFWERGIPAKDSWLFSVLPIPEASWQRRLGRLLRYPFIVLGRLQNPTAQRSQEQVK